MEPEQIGLFRADQKGRSKIARDRRERFGTVSWSGMVDLEASRGVEQTRG
jgi:hypothetical protein